jgi:CMP-2-keto-3-deoxyoctulosonic acid synthetase
MPRYTSIESCPALPLVAWRESLADRISFARSMFRYLLDPSSGASNDCHLGIYTREDDFLSTFLQSLSFLACV